MVRESLLPPSVAGASSAGALRGAAPGTAYPPHWPEAPLEAWQACDILCLSLDFDQPAGRALMSHLQACGLDMRIGPDGIGRELAAQGSSAASASPVELCILCAQSHIQKPEIRARLERWRELLPPARLLLIEWADAPSDALPQAAPGHAMPAAPSGGVQETCDGSGIAAILAEAGLVFREELQITEGGNASAANDAGEASVSGATS